MAFQVTHLCIADSYHLHGSCDGLQYLGKNELTIQSGFCTYRALKLTTSPSSLENKVK